MKVKVDLQPKGEEIEMTDVCPFMSNFETGAGSFIARRGKKMKNKDRIIEYCPNCNWKIIREEPEASLEKCPKCKSYTFEISQVYHHNKFGKLIAKEFSLTDRDEWGISADDWREAKRIIDKGFKLLKKEIKSNLKN